VTVAGTGALTIVTNDSGGGKKSNTGEFIIVPERGSVQFWDLASSLVIDGNDYTLVGDIKTLAADIAANPSGFYALAKPYDASADGTYTVSAIPVRLEGVFEGLGNTISNFTLRFGAQIDLFGFFKDVGVEGIVRDFGLRNADLGGANGILGTLSGSNEGIIQACWADGKLTGPKGSDGGLLGTNGGLVSRSFC